MWNAFTWTLAIVAALFHLGGTASALHAIWNCRTSASAIAWSLALVLFPYLTLPAYWVLGTYRFAGYQRAFRAGAFDKAAVANYIQEVGKFAIPNAGPVEVGFQRLADFPITGSNRVELLIDGEQTFAVLFEEIEKAEKYILLEYFLIADDDIGRQLKNSLIKKAGQGVACYFVYDELGSLGLPWAYIRDLREAGVKIFPFYPARVGAGRLQFNFRNHRKITVVDGRVALIGGINIHDDSLGRNPFYGDWRDTHVLVEGPAVEGIQLAFLSDYFWASDGMMPDVLDLHPAPAAGNHDTKALYVASGPADPTDVGTLFFMHCINTAQSRIWLATPYFVPVASVLDALKAAALRGVEIKIIIPLRWDFFMMYLAAYSYLPEAAANGIEIYRYRAGHPHQKVMLIDDHTSWVGSSNLDARSMQLNFEGNLVVFGQEFASQVERMLQHDLDRSEPMSRDDYDKRSLLFKLGVKIARLFDTIL
ncbi:cardiolipin synthase [bacterium]|nr:cardiolipin synthase [bacterium]